LLHPDQQGTRARRRFDGGESFVTEKEMQQLRQLAGEAQCLARLRDRHMISDTEYVDKLNVLRRQHGLWPLPLPERNRTTPKHDHNEEQTAL